MVAVPSKPAVQTSATLPLQDILENPLNHRRAYDKEQLQELAESIKSVGVLQPVLVRSKGDRYELVYGHRRFRAANLAGLKAIPAQIRELTDREVLEVALVENCRRADIQPLEEAEAYRDLRDKHGLKVEEIAERVGKSKESVYARLKLCELTDAGKNALADGVLTASSALEVARLEPKLQEKAVKKILDRTIPAEGEEPAEPPSTRNVRFLVEDLQHRASTGNAAAKANYKAEKARREAQEAKFKADQEKRTAEHDLRKKVADRALVGLVERVERSKETAMSFLRWIALEVLHEDPTPAERRGWADDKTWSGKVAGLKEPELRGLIFEALVGQSVTSVWNGYSPELKRLADVYRLSIKELEGQVRAEQKAVAEPEKAEPKTIGEQVAEHKAKKAAKTKPAKKSKAKAKKGGR
jgi:ParB/RepB/Spo0J family partition protein